MSDSGVSVCEEHLKVICKIFMKYVTITNNSSKFFVFALWIFKKVVGDVNKLCHIIGNWMFENNILTPCKFCQLDTTVFIFVQVNLTRRHYWLTILTKRPNERNYFKNAFPTVRPSESISRYDNGWHVILGEATSGHEKKFPNFWSTIFSKMFCSLNC